MSDKSLELRFTFQIRFEKCLLFKVYSMNKIHMLHSCLIEMRWFQVEEKLTNRRTLETDKTLALIMRVEFVNNRALQDVGERK